MKLKIFLLTTYTLLVTFVIINTPARSALENDATSYYQSALQMSKENNIAQSFFSFSPQFIDRGYPAVLAIFVKIFGPNIVVLQALNYIFWLVTTYLIYRSLVLLRSKYAAITTVFMLLSPLYLTFSAKLYSEPLAAMGVSLLIYSLVTIFKQQSRMSIPTLITGGVILCSTKSVMLPLIFLLIVYLLIKDKKRYAIVALLIPFILLPSIYASSGGGRSLYNLNIQSSKVTGTYADILSCIPYYISYPLGQKLLPNYQGVCHQNNPSTNMPGYDRNPYFIASQNRGNSYTYAKWLQIIVTHPLKYLLVMVVSMFNIVLVEGVYPSILLLLPILAQYILFAIKIIISLTLWILTFRQKKIVMLLPIMYFFIIVGQFPVEPRYFYPLVPYLYFLVGLNNAHRHS